MAVVLVFSAVMAVRQVIANQSRHAELREAFILLQSKGHIAEASLALPLPARISTSLISIYQMFRQRYLCRPFENA